MKSRELSRTLISMARWSLIAAIIFWLRSINSCSRKVVWKNVHLTIPKGNMGYAQYTVPDTVVVEPTFVAFLCMHLFPRTFLEIAVYSKHKLSTILVANVTNLFRFVALTFWFNFYSLRANSPIWVSEVSLAQIGELARRLQFLCILSLHIIFMIELTLWDTVSMNLAQ